MHYVLISSLISSLLLKIDWKDFNIYFFYLILSTIKSGFCLHESIVIKKISTDFFYAFVIDKYNLIISGR